MRLLPMALLIAGACSGAPSLDELTRHRGCGDVTFAALVPGGRTAYLSVSTPDLLDQARAAGAEVTTTFALPDPRVQVKLVTGEELFEPCDDLAYPDRIDAVYEPTAGAATFTVTSDSDELPAGHGTVELDDVILEAEGDVLRIDRFVIGPVSLGPLPG